MDRSGSLPDISNQSASRALISFLNCLIHQQCPDEDTIKSFFLNTLKEANYLRYSNIDSINQLSVKESSDLWAGVLRGMIFPPHYGSDDEDESDRFWNINKILARKQTKDRTASDILRLDFTRSAQCRSKDNAILWPNSPPRTISRIRRRYRIILLVLILIDRRNN